MASLFPNLALMPKKPSSFVYPFACKLWPARDNTHLERLGNYNNSDCFDFNLDVRDSRTNGGNPMAQNLRKTFEAGRPGKAWLTTSPKGPG